ncbi:hypothetical protein PV387_03350 [Streptomyces sp. ME02-6987-2C]|uniref:hypothetical protein n=1 Tax=unclassified Streptomyces TaxID=2593676 RepID=UPI0029BACAB9|nr:MULTISPECIES: hypothetical protein [unclassified Streptomyces]MDX3345875.1 hypothetical protein [Streptomyces sp. ME02-6979A]MDX3365070.1 hypothetical protein [Streptomyces sp. ME02-6987-2C]MDX3404875.1 hypothetical protein [Streptomyces sp. ME02-6977A]MDX3421641.1 hypothetical protein [Streptomyces sp. ME02-6985-2c]
MAVNLLAVHETAESLLACVCATLTETAAVVDGQPGCPCAACVVAGTPAWDSCDGGCAGGETPGQLTVHFAGMVATSNFPQETRDVIGSRNCYPVKAAAEYVVTLLRCAPSFTKEGCPPSCEEQTDAGRVLAVDAASIWNALECCFPSTSPARRGQQFVLGAQRTLGPEGGCVGVEQRVIVALPSCRCPEGGTS